MPAKFNDTRDITIREREKIGFTDLKDKWSKEPAYFTEDTLTIAGHPVMERWEDSYMNDLATIASKQGGRVLEVGFGLGISAGYVQKHPVTEHVIIEANHEVAKRAHVFAANAKHKTTILQGFWEHVTPTLSDGSFDGILFDTYPLTVEEVHRNHFNFFKEAFRLLKPGGVFTYYSDEINSFAPDHLALLKDAGFSMIDGQVCKVNPPLDCQYWKSNTILAPIIKKSMDASSPTRSYGLHITLDAYGANPKKLEDVGLLFHTLDALPGLIGMHKIGFPHIAEFTQKDIAGISGVVMIVESHISMHTYSKKDFLSLDVYSCKDFDYQKVVDHIKQVYEFKEMELNVIVRGKRFPTHNLHD